MPSPYEAVLLALAAWRVWHLIALDDITDRPRRYITDKTSRWVSEEGRSKLLDFIECPYCMGFWVSLGWILMFVITPDPTMWAALVFAVNAGVIAAARVMSSDD